jgi:hypothetical protein
VIRSSDSFFRVLFIVVPTHLIDADRCRLLQIEESRCQQVFVDMMQQRCELQLGVSPLLAFGISTHAQLLGLRRVQQHLANCGAFDVAFPLTGQSRHAKVRIPELKSWPAFPSITDA